MLYLFMTICSISAQTCELSKVGPFASIEKCSAERGAHLGAVYKSAAAKDTIATASCKRVVSSPVIPG